MNTNPRSDFCSMWLNLFLVISSSSWYSPLSLSGIWMWKTPLFICCVKIELTLRWDTSPNPSLHPLCIHLPPSPSGQRHSKQFWKAAAKGGNRNPAKKKCIFDLKHVWTKRCKLVDAAIHTADRPSVQREVIPILIISWGKTAVLLDFVQMRARGPICLEHSSMFKVRR